MFISLYAACMFILNDNKFNTIEYYTMFTDLETKTYGLTHNYQEWNHFLVFFSLQIIITHFCLINFSRNSKRFQVSSSLGSADF